MKAEAGLDEFITEKYANDIAAILASWSAGMMRSPRQLTPIENVLAANFVGASLRPLNSALLRSGPAVEAHYCSFASDNTLAAEAFLKELASYLETFSEILTSELQLTSIDVPEAEAPGSKPVTTRVRYELVGAGAGWFREQRVGNWDLEWELDAAGRFRLQNWQTVDEARSRAATPVFTDVTETTLGGNSSYKSQLVHGTDHWRTVLDGACGIDIYGHNGVAVGDMDGDGFDDLYVCQPGGLPNRLYRNRGDGTFEDMTETSGVGVLDNTACALFLDIDNDGRQDLVVVRASGPLLFLNEGGARFRQKRDAFQFATPPQGTFTGAAAADYDRDGWLDIYFCLYVYYQAADQYKYPTPYYDAQNGPPNFLMRNQRDGSFRDVTRETGLDRNNTRYSFCCGWADLNGNGWPDLYVVNDFGRKNLYRNNGDGTFTDIASQAGVEDIGAGMSGCSLDYDNDGAADLYVANMWTAAGERVSGQPNFTPGAPDDVRALYRKHAMGNSLFLNRGRRFEDTTQYAGVGVGRWAWSSDAWDFDHDGFEDLYVTNGMVSGPSRDDLNSFFWRQVVAKSPENAKPSHDYEQGWNAINELIRADGTWSGFERNIFYANNGNGTFSDVSGAVGLDFLEDGRSFALADFDHDGRQELFLKNRNAPQLRILKNVIDNLPPSIAFRLTGVKSNRDAIGAVITIETNEGRRTRGLPAGSGFLSQHSKEVFFGLGAVKGALKASIRWPSGAIQELSDLKPNHRVWVTEGAPPTRIEPFQAMQPGKQRAPLASTRVNVEVQGTIETWLLAPIAAPDFALPDFSGDMRSLASFRGRPVLLNFWAMESANCRRDLALFQRVHMKWKAQGLELMAVNVDPASKGVQSFVMQNNFLFPIVRGSEDVAAIYNILYRQLFDRHRDLGLPASFLIDEAGDIVKVYRGPLTTKQVETDFREIPHTPQQRLTKALPFPGVTEVEEFGRNYLTYGSVFFQRGYFDQAQAAFERALRDNPESAEAVYGIGSVHLNLGKTAEARESFERATKLHASYPETLANSWNNLGLLSAREEHTAEAIALFLRALQLNPDHAVALVNLGSAYRQLRQWNEGQRYFERALALNPADPEANYGLAMIFAQTGEPEEALQHFQAALRSRPFYPEALNNLGIFYLRTQRRDEAVARFEECIRVAPAFDQAYLNLARVYAVEGAPEKARFVLLELLRQHPEHAQATEMLDQLGR